MRITVVADDIEDVRAVDVARAAATGLRKYAVDRELETDVQPVPLGSGGPGFIHSLNETLDGNTHIHTVTGPLGEVTPASIFLRDEGRGITAYLEAAEACGVHLTESQKRNPLIATSQGIGELINAALGLGATRIIVGIGGTATNDAGAGMLARLGAGEVQKLGRGPQEFENLNARDIDLRPVRQRLAGIDLIAACATDAPLLGFHGASGGYAGNKGADRGMAQELERYLSRFANQSLEALISSEEQEHSGHLELLNSGSSSAPLSELRSLPGSGSGGGIGYALALLGARLLPGSRVMASEIGLANNAETSDVIVALTDHLDATTLSQGPIPVAAEIAASLAIPAIVVARRVDSGTRELAAAGITSAYPLVDLVSTSTSPHEVIDQIEERLYRVARSWAR